MRTHSNSLPCVFSIRKKICNKFLYISSSSGKGYQYPRKLRQIGIDERQSDGDRKNAKYNQGNSSFMTALAHVKKRVNQAIVVRCIPP
jgi:hypothetical protein